MKWQTHIIGYVISDGTTGELSQMIVILSTNAAGLAEEIKQFAAITGTPIDQVTVNPIGPPVGGAA